jgi:thiol:disulfide interchange protein DsbD
LTDGDAAARRPFAGKLALSILGIGILALAVFAILNVELLDQWGASLATRFKGGLSLPVALLVVFVAGILTSLTPCVYPVVPLAITYLGARSATSRLKAFSLAAAYVVGMVACYTALGAVAGLTGTTFGAATQKWWVYALVATIVVLFGLSMFGVFTIALPSRLQGLIGRGKGPGYRGAFLMGATSGLVTAPCTAPVLGTLILPMISKQSVAQGSLLLAVFGLGMGMLFLVVGTYSGVLTSLPRSGSWMNGVKYVLGVAILAVAAYFYWQAWTLLPWRGSRPQMAPVAPSAAAPARSGTPEVLAAALRQDAESATPAPAPAPEAPAQAPAFELEDLKGRRHNLSAYTGKTLHLFFFAAWCPLCVEQLRTVEVADVRLRGRGYRVVLVAMKERESPESLRAFAEQRSLGLPIALDRDGEVARRFGVTGIPAHVVIAPGGRIVYQKDELPEGFERDGAGLLPP